VAIRFLTLSLKSILFHFIYWQIGILNTNRDTTSVTSKVSHQLKLKTTNFKAINMGKRGHRLEITMTATI
jgi:cell division protein FtsL